MKPGRRIRSDLQDRTEPPFPGRTRRWQHWIAHFHLRDYWWRLLDVFEHSRAWRIALYLTATTVVAGWAGWFWLYPVWAKHNAIRIAQGWLAAGQLRNAAEAAQQAAQVAPERPEPWQIASELARLGHQDDQSLRYAHRAAELAPADPGIIIAWAAAALRAGETAEAVSALARLTADQIAASPEALRIRGELARRELRLTAARNFFEAALKLEGPQAVNEVPLGLVLLNAVSPAERQHGLALLEKWTPDREWGLTALRMLLEDALTRNDPPAMVRWAEALRAHPGFAVSDMPRYLQALSLADPARYAQALSALEKDHAVSPAAAAQLLSWLNQIGKGAEAVRWMKTLPAAGMRRPPLVVAGAEALRQAGDWPGLQDWVETGDWGPEVEFLRWTYGLLSARKLGREDRAQELWRTLFSHAQLNGSHGLFASSSLFSWGLVSEAETLWWRVAELEGPLALEALGSLARYYQVNRDADGQYRVFRRLHLLQPENADISNNFAFFALLLGREQRVANEAARGNFERDPGNVSYLATQAFALTQQGRFADALALLKPKSSLVAASPGLAFAYGLALAGSGRKDDARQILNRIPPATLTAAEADLIRQVLAD